ncbi:hypothetical protein B7494_g3985 [Chlorociboria aeruginascens]|nr:hypothetical protein B7494_g3985 [Chlorociboria aeruginascens]
MDSSFSDHTVLIPGPSFHVDLSALDARHPVHYGQRLLIFRCTSSTQRDAQLAAFKTAVQALVSRCPILGGIVIPLLTDEVKDDQEDWRTIVPDGGIELIVKDLRTSMPTFEELEAADFPALKFPYDLLVPVPRGLGNDRPFAACKMQFSAIEGGTILTFAMSHSVADGGGLNELMRVLSEETRLAQEPSSEGGTANTTIIGLDRSALQNITSEIPFKIEDHPAYISKTSNAPPHPEVPTNSLKATSPEIPITLRISAAGLAQLKADATLPDAPMISTHDALSALLWRTVLLIRRRRSPIAQSLPPSTTSSIFMPSDVRRHLNLPESYIGNVVYQLTATLNFGTLLSPSGVQHGANAIRRAITSVKPELVASLMVQLKHRWVEWGFVAAYSTTGLAMGTSWTSGVLYGADWGQAFGPLVRYRYPAGPGNWIMPKLPDGSAEVVVGVMPSEMEILKGEEGFEKYLGMR